MAMLTCDVTDDESVSALISTVLAQTGRIDLLVNNAGIGLLGGAEEFSIPQVQALFDVNLFGVIRMTNAVLPSMRQGGQGRIINIGSILGLVAEQFADGALIQRTRGKPQKIENLEAVRKLKAEGMTQAQIAQELGFSPSVVNRHWKRILSQEQQVNR